jgi:hypothetical protein
VLDANRLVGLLAEPERRRIVAAMILGAIDLNDIVKTSGLSTRVVVDSLDRMEAAGLVESGEGATWILLEEAFKRAAREAAPGKDPTQFPDEPESERRLLDTAFSDGRLVRLPTKWSRRRVVLEHLAQRFEPGRRYTERQVNAALAQVHDDTAALRRYLVDDGFLDREHGEYWRSGGRVDLDEEGTD